jgi:sodium transport system permease protein
MSAVHTVWKKEVLDNFRDRRTLISALVMGPIFGPILFAFIINISLKQNLSDESQALDVPVIGRAHAPNLVQFLASRNLNIIDGPASRDAAIESVSSGELDLVVIVTPRPTRPARTPMPSSPRRASKFSMTIRTTARAPNSTRWT